MKQSWLANCTIQGTWNKLAPSCYPCKRKKRPVSSFIGLYSKNSTVQHWDSNLLLLGSSAFSSKTGNIELGLDSTQPSMSCHVIVWTAYPFPWGRGVLLLEPIPALSQGEGRVSHQFIAGPSLMSNVGFSISLKDTSTCSSALPRAGIWTNDLLSTSRPALPAELQPPTA